MDDSKDTVKDKSEVKTYRNEDLDKARSIIYYVLSVIEVLLAFRFIFKLLGANPASPVVSLLYGITRIILLPFSGIFRSIITRGVETQAIFEPEIIIAAIVYALIARGIVKLMEIILLNEKADKA